MDMENSCSMRWVTRKMYQCTLSDNALEKSRHGASPPMCVSDVTGSWAPLGVGHQNGNMALLWKGRNSYLYTSRSLRPLLLPDSVEVRVWYTRKLCCNYKGFHETNCVWVTAAVWTQKWWELGKILRLWLTTKLLNFINIWYIIENYNII